MNEPFYRNGKAYVARPSTTLCRGCAFEKDGLACAGAPDCGPRGSAVIFVEAIALTKSNVIRVEDDQRVAIHLKPDAGERYPISDYRITITKDGSLEIMSSMGRLQIEPHVSNVITVRKV